MSLADELSDAASEAQGYLAELQGSAPGEDNFVGPDGKLYILVFRAADAFESQAAGMEMQSHGYGNKSLIIATATRSQFTVAPIGWRGLKGTRLTPAPSQEVTILSVATDDPLHYVINLIGRQPIAR